MIYNMMFRWRTHLHPLFLCFAIACFALISGLRAQSSNLDSLELVMQTKKLNTTEQLELYYRLSWGYMDVHTEKAFSFARLGIKFAENAKSEKDLEWLAQLYCNLGVGYDMISKYDSALYYFDKSISIALSIKNERQEARGYICIGNLYLGMGDYQNALEYFMRALPMLEKQGDPQRVGILLHNIGTVYQYLSNMEQAMKYFLRVEKITRETGDWDGLGSVLVSLSEITLNEGKDIDKALDYARLAVDIKREINDKYGECIALLQAARCCYLLNVNLML